jgi:hypothetical protein
LLTGSKNQKISVPRYYPVSGRVAISGRKGNAFISVKWENDEDEENWFEKSWV